MVETNVFFGTAFPQQTERDKRLGNTDAGQFLPAWKQEARDEQGRRRFHGAFTGGFSAGYFNTVGSKEGWTPSQFVSSRSSRGEQKVARVEDFMDEEDLQELASTKRLVTTDEFNTLSGTEKELEKRRQQQLDEDAKRGNNLTDLTSSLLNLVAPTQDSTGMRLLRKMGWRPGQGVGPRTAFSSENDNDKLEMTLAPKDTPIVDYQTKTNTFGLGYDIVKHVPQVAEMRRFQQQQEDQRQHPKSTSRLGLGVFDNDDDDTMLYDDEPAGFSRKYHHTLYEDNEYVSDSRRTGNKRKQATSDDLTTKKARCSDGHLPLKGFHLSLQPQEIGKWYPPPTVPADFNEMHTQPSVSKIKAPTSDQASITIDARGAMLGEKPIEARSVFDYMSSKTKERLAQVTTSLTEPVADKTRLQVSLIPKDVAQLALHGFMPFGDAPEKQARYKHFLESSLAQQKSNSSSTEAPATTITFDIPTGMTHESGMKELNEFTQAARIFRPISSMMSSRFTTSTETATAASPHVEQVAFEGGLKTEEQWKQEKKMREMQVMDEPKPKLSQEAEAAAMNMFGSMTRTQLPFYPNRLLCKRFNVRNPHPDHVPQGPGHRTQAGSTSALDEKTIMSMLAPQKQSPVTTTSTPSSKLTLADTQDDDPALRAIIAKPSSRTDDSSAEEKDKDKSDEELNYERPTMDIFKAIFETSDSESDSEEDKDKIDKDTFDISNKPAASPSLSTSITTMAGPNNVNNNDDFIGPPVPPAADPSPPSPPTEQPAFRPVFTKRESQDTKVHSEQVMVKPFQSRFSSSSSSGKKRTQRRRVSVSSEGSSTSENNNSDTDVDRSKEKKRRQQQHESSHRLDNSSSASRKDNKKKKKDKKKESHLRKRKHQSSRHHARSDSEEKEDRKRHRGSRKEDQHDRDRSNKHSKHSKHSIHDQEEDMSLWVEKKPSLPRRSRAEDLW